MGISWVQTQQLLFEELAPRKTLMSTTRLVEEHEQVKWRKGIHLALKTVMYKEGLAKPAWPHQQ